MGVSPTSFRTNPDSLRQRVLAQVPYDTGRSSTDICDALGIVERRQRVVAMRALTELADDGLVEKLDEFVIGRGRPARKYRRLRERRRKPQPSAQERKFAAAKRLVERAGWVLVPRRAP